MQKTTVLNETPLIKWSLIILRLTHMLRGDFGGVGICGGEADKGIHRGICEFEGGLWGNEASDLFEGNPVVRRGHSFRTCKTSRRKAKAKAESSCKWREATALKAQRSLKARYPGQVLTKTTERGSQCASKLARVRTPNPPGQV